MADELTWTMTDDEHEALKRLVADVADVPGCILEIGSGVGVTTALLAGWAPKRQIVTIDTFENMPMEASEQRAAFEQRVAGLTNVRTIVAKSQHAAFSEPLAGLIIDGAHDYASCKADIEKYVPMVGVGGFVAFHDFSYSPKFVGVVQAVHELKLGLERMGTLVWAWPQGKPVPKAEVEWPMTALCINLDRRNDRWEDMLRNVAERIPELVKLERFSAIEPNEADVPADFQPLDKSHRAAGWGCVSSHLATVKLAQQRRLPYVLVLEDDARFSEDAAEFLRRAVAQLPETADILYIGGIARGGMEGIYSTELTHAPYYTCSQACLIFRRAYSKILKQVARLAPEPWDLVMRHVQLEKYGTVRPLAGQAGGPSDLIGHVSARMLVGNEDAAATPFVHVLGLPNVPLDTRVGPSNAFVWNCERFCRMLAKAHVPFAYYGPPDSVVPDGGQLVSTGYPKDTWKYGNDWHKEYTKRIREGLDATIPDVQSYRQIVASLYGFAHADAYHYSYPPFVEAMVGYRDCWATYKVFPSYAHQAVTYTGKPGFAKMPWFDTVIPHFVDAARYQPSDDREDYALFLGRAAADKGGQIAQQACHGSGIELRIFHDGLTGQRKLHVISHARVVFCPTLYQEPGGLVAIEAQMCGVPVLATDWGCFTETVEHGVSGFLCRTMAEFKAGLAHALELDPGRIRRRAETLFSFDAVASQYLPYFDFVQRVTVGDYYDPRAVRWAQRAPGHAPSGLEMSCVA
jgi:GR25 family glycosyltransferase involved in LPS biosynthesis